MSMGHHGRVLQRPLDSDIVGGYIGPDVALFPHSINRQKYTVAAPEMHLDV